MMEGFVFSIVRTSLHDGPGIRTVVYLKGCSLRCAWCHNPEGLSPQAEVLRHPDRCIGCGRCADRCPEHIRGGEPSADCRHCGTCAGVCPGGALTVCGESYPVERLMAILRKDRHYYRRSGGGVTFSGGECLLQPDFVTETARQCQAEGIHTLCETALHVKRESLAAAAAHMDIIYADLKHMDPAAHEHWTGADNHRILSNLRYLAEHHNHVVVRIPLIPGVNDASGNLAASATFLAECGGGIRAVELLKYNELAGSKYASAGRDASRFADWKPQTDADMDEKRTLLSTLLPASIPVL